MLKSSRLTAPSAGLIVLALLCGCSGTVPPPDSGNTDTHTAPPPPAPGDTVSDENAASREVQLWSGSSHFIINDFRIDFAKMRNIYGLYGFYPDRWDRMEQIPFSSIREFLIKENVDDYVFGNIYKGREEYQLNQQEIFRVVIMSAAGETFDYIAIIPKIRGFRDGQRWEQPMAGNPLRLERIVLST